MRNASRFCKSIKNECCHFFVRRGVLGLLFTFPRQGNYLPQPQFPAPKDLRIRRVNNLRIRDALGMSPIVKTKETRGNSLECHLEVISHLPQILPSLGTVLPNLLVFSEAVLGTLLSMYKKTEIGISVPILAFQCSCPLSMQEDFAGQLSSLLKLRRWVNCDKAAAQW